ncbi:MAG: hypothetical protein L6R40_004897 [Gallowayella cf. fulva]|nr:MAG: hypothetical protein L6R40_004897 [Xanthomendoza cf. fulva]
MDRLTNDRISGTLIFATNKQHHSEATTGRIIKRPLRTVKRPPKKRAQKPALEAHAVSVGAGASGKIASILAAVTRKMAYCLVNGGPEGIRSDSFSLTKATLSSLATADDDLDAASDWLAIPQPRLVPLAADSFARFALCNTHNMLRIALDPTETRTQRKIPLEHNDVFDV